MHDNRTHSILQHLPLILAVTAASFGLPVEQAQRAAIRVGSLAVPGGTDSSLAPQPQAELPSNS